MGVGERRDRPVHTEVAVDERGDGRRRAERQEVDQEQQPPALGAADRRVHDDVAALHLHRAGRGDVVDPLGPAGPHDEPVRAGPVQLRDAGQHRHREPPSTRPAGQGEQLRHYGRARCGVDEAQVDRRGEPPRPPGSGRPGDDLGGDQLLGRVAAGRLVETRRVCPPQPEVLEVRAPHRRRHGDPDLLTRRHRDPDRAAVDAGAEGVAGLDDQPQRLEPWPVARERHDHRLERLRLRHGVRGAGVVEDQSDPVGVRVGEVGQDEVVGLVDDVLPLAQRGVAVRGDRLEGDGGGGVRVGARGQHHVRLRPGGVGVVEARDDLVQQGPALGQRQGVGDALLVGVGGPDRQVEAPGGLRVELRRLRRHDVPGGLAHRVRGLRRKPAADHEARELLAGRQQVAGDERRRRHRRPAQVRAGGGHGDRAVGRTVSARAGRGGEVLGAALELRPHPPVLGGAQDDGVGAADPVEGRGGRSGGVGPAPDALVDPSRHEPVHRVIAGAQPLRKRGRRPACRAVPAGRPPRVRTPSRRAPGRRVRPAASRGPRRGRRRGSQRRPGGHTTGSVVRSGRGRWRPLPGSVASRVPGPPAGGRCCRPGRRRAAGRSTPSPTGAGAGTPGVRACGRGRPSPARRRARARPAPSRPGRGRWSARDAAPTGSTRPSRRRPRAGSRGWCPSRARG